MHVHKQHTTVACLCEKLVDVSSGVIPLKSVFFLK